MYLLTNLSTPQTYTLFSVALWWDRLSETVMALGKRLKAVQSERRDDKHVWAWITEDEMEEVVENAAHCKPEANPQPYLKIQAQ